MGESEFGFKYDPEKLQNLQHSTKPEQLAGKSNEKL